MTSSAHRLEAALIELGSDLDWPRGVDLSQGVLNRLEIPPRRSYRWLVPALTALAVLALLFTPPGKAAVGWLLRVAGIKIEFTQDTTPTSTAQSMVIGETATLAEAEAAADFDVQLPGSLPSPDSIQVASLGGLSQVVMVWNASEQLPEVFDTGTGMIIFQFRATVDRELITKHATEATTVDEVTVQGVKGYFLSGAPHFMYFENDGRPTVEDTVRLAANVLIWEKDGVTYRIESELGRDETLAVAESLR